MGEQLLPCSRLLRVIRVCVSFRVQPISAAATPPLAPTPAPPATPAQPLASAALAFASATSALASAALAFTSATSALASPSRPRARVLPRTRHRLPR